MKVLGLSVNSQNCVFCWVVVWGLLCSKFIHNSIMVLSKEYVEKQVAWALNVRDPFLNLKLEIASCKWVGAGHEIRFNGGVGLVACCGGRELGIVWERMSDVERTMFASDCENLLGKNVSELWFIDHGLLCSLFRLLKTENAERKIFFGEGEKFAECVKLVGDDCGVYVDLGNLSDNTWAMVGNYLDAEQRMKAFTDSLTITVRSVNQ